MNIRWGFIAYFLVLTVLSGCYEAKIIKGSFVKDARIRDFQSIKTKYLQVIDQTARKHEFIVYDRADTHVVYPSGDAYLASYQSAVQNALSGEVAIHVIAKGNLGIPDIYIQGKDTYAKLIHDTAKDIIINLKQHFPEIQFTIENSSQNDFI